MVEPRLLQSEPLAYRGEHALVREHQLLRTLLDNVPDRIYFKDARGHFLRINQTVAARFGLADPALAQGKSDEDFFSVEAAATFCADKEEVLRMGSPLIAKEDKEVGRTAPSPGRPPRPSR